MPNTTDYRCTWTDAELLRITSLAAHCAPELDSAGIALEFAAHGFTAQEAYDWVDNGLYCARTMRTLIDFGHTYATLLDDELLEKALALANA